MSFKMINCSLFGALFSHLWKGKTARSYRNGLTTQEVKSVLWNPSSEFSTKHRSCSRPFSVNDLRCKVLSLMPLKNPGVVGTRMVKPLLWEMVWFSRHHFMRNRMYKAVKEKQQKQWKWKSLSRWCQDNTHLTFSSGSSRGWEDCPYITYLHVGKKVLSIKLLKMTKSVF